MAGDVEQQGQEPVESTEHDADFAAGLTGSAPTETPTPTPEPSPEPSPEPTEAPKYVQISEDEWNDTKSRAARVDELSASLDKRLEQVYGKVGRSIEQAVSKLKAETPAGEVAEVGDDDFKEMQEMYPELSEVQIPMLKKLIGKVKGTADPQALQKLVDERLQAQQSAQLSAKADELAEIHPTWRSDLWAVPPSTQGDVFVPGKPSADYEAWRKTMTPQEVAKFENSNSTLYVDRKLQQFYAWKTAQAAQAQTPKPASARARQIAAAVPPRGDGGLAPGSSSDEDDAFMAGLKGG